MGKTFWPCESHHDWFSRKGRGILVYDQSNINKVSCLILATEVHHLSHGRWQNGSFQDEEKLRIQKLKIYICISLLTKRRKGNMFQKYDWSTIKDNFSNCQKVSQQFFFFSVFGMSSYVHSDRGTSLISRKTMEWFFSRWIGTDKTTSYNVVNGRLKEYKQYYLESQHFRIGSW